MLIAKVRQSDVRASTGNVCQEVSPQLYFESSLDRVYIEIVVPSRNISLTDSINCHIGLGVCSSSSQTSSVLQIPIGYEIC